jgi:hypothetical protein
VTTVQRSTTLLYEHHTEPLLPRPAFLRRMANHGLVAAGVTLAALAIGVAGYRGFEGLSWPDAVLNASMILGGMGPVSPLHTTAGKLFASAYALFSGVVFLAIAGLLFVPLLHRLLHRFHLETEDGE